MSHKAWNLFVKWPWLLYRGGWKIAITFLRASDIWNVLLIREVRWLHTCTCQLPFVKHRPLNSTPSHKFQTKRDGWRIQMMMSYPLQMTSFPPIHTHTHRRMAVGATKTWEAVVEIPHTHFIASRKSLHTASHFVHIMWSPQHPSHAPVSLFVPRTNLHNGDAYVGLWLVSR
jgi:hypothetical protein